MDRTVASLLCVALACVGMEGSGAPRGADGRSDADARAALHDYMMVLYRSHSKLQQKDANVSRASVNTITGFVDQGQDLPTWESGQRYIFDLSSLSKVDALVKAELRILRKPTSEVPVVPATKGNPYYSIRLYSCSAEGTSEMQLLDSRTVEVLDGGLSRWEVFPVFSSIKACLKGRTEPQKACFHLEVLSELTNGAADPLPLGLGRHARTHRQKALLVVFSHTDTRDSLFKEVMEKLEKKGGGFRQPGLSKPHGIPERKNRRNGQSGRKGRGAAGGGKSGRRRARCSRKPLFVNFKDLGWDDWIIAPINYEAHHCEGACNFPLRSHLEPTNHAVIQTLLNSIDPGISPPSCCVPSKLSPISILYIDSSNNVVYKKYDDMVVESCGCR